MQWLVVSDTHGDRDGLKMLRERHEQDVQAIFHCGDSELASDDPLLQSVYVVSGNTDLRGTFPEHEEPKIAGINIWMTHGHLYQVKNSNQLLQQTAVDKGVQLVLHGHSHFAGAYEKDGIIYVNPGSLTLPKKPREATYAIITVENGEVQAVRFYEKESGEEMKSLSF
ncbi:metallophosphoesterase [Natribacillus halophilus]|nr:metallophosphoesterase [Natribacillus halophilus]